MNVSKEQIKNGLIKYLEEDVVKSIGDKPVKMVMAVLANMIKANSGIVDKLLDNSIISIMFGKTYDDTYDLDNLYEAIIQTMNEYGTFDLRIPFLHSPFTFNVNDVNNLKSYIEGGVNDDRENIRPI